MCQRSYLHGKHLFHLWSCRAARCSSCSQSGHGARILFEHARTIQRPGPVRCISYEYESGAWNLRSGRHSSASEAKRRMAAGCDCRFLLAGYLAAAELLLRTREWSGPRTRLGVSQSPRGPRDCFWFLESPLHPIKVQRGQACGVPRPPEYDAPNDRVITERSVLIAGAGTAGKRLVIRPWIESMELEASASRSTMPRSSASSGWMLLTALTSTSEIRGSREPQAHQAGRQIGPGSGFWTSIRSPPCIRTGPTVLTRLKATGKAVWDARVSRRGMSTDRPSSPSEPGYGQSFWI